MCMVTSRPMNEITVWDGDFLKNFLFLRLGYDASQDHNCDGYCEDLKFKLI